MGYKQEAGAFQTTKKDPFNAMLNELQSKKDRNMCQEALDILMTLRCIKEALLP